jgi:hypothetical protein
MDREKGDEEEDCAHGEREISLSEREKRLGKDASLGHTVERNAARETELLLAGDFSAMTRHSEKYFRGDLLDAAGQTFIALAEERFWFAGLAT